MNPESHSLRRLLAIGAACALAMMAAPQAQSAGLVGQLGILDTSGTNPATGQPWQVGDTYHLVFVTTNTTTATSTNIADYNTFVQSEANASGLGTALWGTGAVNWFALGSTSSVNAIDNAVITGPAFDIYHSLNPGDSFTGSGFLATDAADFWDFNFPPSAGGNSGNPLSNLTGGNNNVWTGTGPGGVASSALGAGGSSRRHWTGWWNWGPAFATQNNADSLPMVAISQQLTVMPEPSTGLLIGLGGLLALLRRRR